MAILVSFVLFISLLKHYYEDDEVSPLGQVYQYRLTDVVDKFRGMVSYRQKEKNTSQL